VKEKDGECSKAIEERESSSDESMQDESTSSHSDDFDYESSPKGGEKFEERAKESYPH
jgi:hypothetical protein